MLLVLAVVLAGTRLVSSWHNRAPYSPAAVAAHASVRLVGAQQAKAAIDDLAGPGRLSPPPFDARDRRQVVVGQVTFRTPRRSSSHGEYVLFVLDKLNGNAPVSQMWGIGPPGTNVGQGWEGTYNNVAHRYPWLRTLASVKVADGWVDPGMAVVMSANTTSPVTFTALLPSTLAVTDPNRRVTIAMVFLGDDGQVYWADRLVG